MTVSSDEPDRSESAATGPGEESDVRRTGPTLLEQMGGVPGVIASTVPVAVFIVANILWELRPALLAALGAGVLVAMWRVARRQALQPAVSGLLGVGIAAFVAYRTGEARDFYLPGLIYMAVLCLAFLVSALVRWPLAGVIWHGINGHGHTWRHNPRLLRAYTLATLLWAAVFGARVLVQGALYQADEATWLGVARLLMGYPLFALALVATIWAVRRAGRTPAPATGRAGG